MGISRYATLRAGDLRSKRPGVGSHSQSAQIFSVPSDVNLWTGLR